MSSVLKDAMDYLGGLGSLLTQSDTCSDGKTDDQDPDNPGKGENFAASKTDARSVASMAFPKGKPVTTVGSIAANGVYEVTQAQSRLVSLYGQSRGEMYEQSKKATEARKNYIKMQQNLYASFLQNSEKASEMLKIK